MEKEWTSLSCPSNDGSEFWAFEWNAHGTCSQSVFDQHAYFQANLNYKNKIDALQALTTAGTCIIIVHVYKNSFIISYKCVT